MYLSVLTLGEIRNGIEKCGDPVRKQILRQWLEHELPAYFAGRILPVSAAVTDRWGRVLAAAPRTLPGIDSLLAATAIEHKLSIVTRNVRDFDGAPVVVINPWDSV